jgi:uncharacterized repeat protein (TIGR01451 family)
MKRKYFVISLLVILFASSWLVLHALAQEQPTGEKEEDASVPSGEGCTPLALSGPDTFGYTYRDSFQMDGPVYDWVEISYGTGITLTDDQHRGPYPIGFPFNFYGNDYTEFYIQSNGTVNFTNTYISLANECPLPVPGNYNNLIALMWDDLDPGDTNDPVYYGTFPAGECPYGGYAGACLVVQYDDFCHYPGGVSCKTAGTFEAILFDNHDILIQYQDAGVEQGSGSTTGIENADGSDGLTYACNTADSLRDGRSVQFYYPGPRLSTSRKTASPIVEMGDRIDYTIEIVNTGHQPAASAILTDVLPANTTYVPGSLTCSSGTCSYVGIDRAVYWNGTLERAPAKGYRPTQGELLIPQGKRGETQAPSADLADQPRPIIPSFYPPGTVLDIFDNTWDISTMGLVYNPGLDEVRYAHEVYSTASIWDVNYASPHTVLGSILLSTINPGWPVGLNRRNGIDYDPGNNVYFLPDYGGDAVNADDNIIEIAPDGTILNAWELGDGLGSNDSYDGAAINSIIDIAVVPGTPPRYFVATAFDGSTVYEIDLIKTGTRWTPDTWGLLGSWNVPGLADNLGIDYDAEHGLLYHSDWGSTNIVATDLAFHTMITTTCASPSGFNTGVTYIEGKSQPEIWVTDYLSNTTTRCAATGGPPCDQSATIFSDNFEAGLGNWTMTGLWNEEHEGDTCGALVAPFPSPDTGAYFGLDGTCTYSTTERVTGTLALEADVDLTGYTYASLNFWSYEDTECTTTFCPWDQRYVDVSTDGGATWATIWAGTGPEASWYQASANLANYVGGPVRVRFRFDSLDMFVNGYFGWMVDNIEIVGCPTPVELTFSVDAPQWCGPVVNHAVLTDPQAEPVTLTAVTQVVEDLYQSWGFEADDGGFIRTVPGEWEWGVPTYPPGLSAHSGDKVWGTDLHGDANDEITEHRLLKSVSLPTHPNGVFLEWWDWNGAENSDYIRVYVEGVQVYSKLDFDQRTWVRHVVDVSAWAGLTVDIEFVLDTSGTNPGPDGWYIDDMSIHSGCIADAQISPPSLEVQACVECTVTSTLTVCNNDNLPLEWRVWEQQAITVQAEASPRPANDPSAGESGPRSGPQGYGMADIHQASQVMGSSCRVALAADDGGNPTEAAELHATLTELGYDWVDVNSVEEARYAGANVLIDRIGAVDMPVNDVNTWLTDSMGYIQIGDWPDWFPENWESQPAGTPLTITVADSAHPLAAGLPASWTGLGFWAYGWPGSNAVGWVTDVAYPNIISAQYSTNRARAVSAATYGPGRAAYIGFNTYGTLASVNDKQVLRNAITWTGHCAEIPWLAEAPPDGVVLPNMCTEVDVTFDATGLAPDDYFANLVIQSNDVFSPLITLPVAFTVIDVAGLSLSMADAPDPVPMEGTLLYTLVIANAGTCTADNVELVDTLPPGVTYVGASHAGCSQAGGVVTCHLGDLPSGGSISLTITVRAPDSMGQITNTAVVSSDSEDPAPANNTASASTDVTRYRMYLPIERRSP